MTTTRLRDMTAADATVIADPVRVAPGGYAELSALCVQDRDHRQDTPECHLRPRRYV